MGKNSISVHFQAQPTPGTRPGEEDATLWLFARPELLGWPHEICWLFSPVVGNTLFPGDLWGIAEDGAVIIVEAKSATPGGADPFEDFLSGSHISDIPRLRTRWYKLLKRERRFVATHLPSLETGTCATTALPGIVPYSSRREVIWRWRDIYRDTIVDAISSARYESEVLARLARAEATRPVKVIYVGLLVSTGQYDPRLSRGGLENYWWLANRVGADRILLRAIEGTVTKNGLDVGSWDLVQTLRLPA